MTKEPALLIKKRAHKAMAELDGLLGDIRSQCSTEEFQIIKRGVGLSMGTIITEILEPVYRQHPEIDDDLQSS